MKVVIHISQDVFRIYSEDDESIYEKNLPFENENYFFFIHNWGG